MFQKDFSLPILSLKMVVLDDDLEMGLFQKHLESTTQTYLNHSFEDVEKVFDLNRDHQYLENLQLSTFRTSRTFVGLQQERHGDAHAPVSFVVASMEGSITYVDQQHTKPSESQLDQVERIIRSTLHFALKDSIHLLMTAFHQDPKLRLITEAQVVLGSTIQGSTDESSQNDREYGIILVDSSNDQQEKYESSSKRYEFSTPVIVAAVASFLMTLTLFSCLAGIGRLVFHHTYVDSSSTGWSLKGDKLKRHRAWVQQGYLTKEEESQNEFSIESRSILYLSTNDDPLNRHYDWRKRILRFMRQKQRKDPASHIDTSSLPSVVMMPTAQSIETVPSKEISV